MKWERQQGDISELLQAWLLGEVGRSGLRACSQTQEGSQLLWQTEEEPRVAVLPAFSSRRHREKW